MDAGQWNERYRASGLVWSGEANIFVREFLADLEPGTALDLGAGEGRNAVWLARRGWEVTAVDFSDVGLAKARDLARAAGVEIDAVAADALTHEPPEPVDLVVLSYLQIPAADQERVLRRIPRWLRPGGHVLVVAHDKSNVASGWGGPPSESVCYDAAATAAALAPLDVVVAEVRRRSVPGADRPALDTVVWARSPAVA